MFSADLSWQDHSAEKVGARRQRRATKRENSISSSTSGSKKDGRETNHQTKSSLGSITKTISFSSVKDSMRRPSTATSHLKSPSVTILETSAPYAEYKDPSQQPDYIYSAKLGPRLPSGAVLESPRPQQYALPVRTVQAHQVAIYEESPIEAAASPQIPSGPHGAWSVKNQSEADNICQSYQQVKDEIMALQNPDAITPHPEPTYSHKGPLPACPEYDEHPTHIADLARPPSELGYNFLNIEEETPKTKYVLPVSGLDSKLELPPIFRSSPAHHMQVEGSPPVPPKTSLGRSPSTKVSQWAAPDNWDIVKSQVEIRKILDSDSSNEDSQDNRRQSILVGSHFQRFVRRMESAGPRIIFERLKEEWETPPSDRAMDDELSLEKHLWALTALQLPSMDRFARQQYSVQPSHPLPPLTPKRRRKILELDGSIGQSIISLNSIPCTNIL